MKRSNTQAKKNLFLFCLVLFTYLYFLSSCYVPSLGGTQEYSSKWKIKGSTVIDVSDSTLNQFSSHNREQLLKYLASCASWHVTRVEKTSQSTEKIVAIRRKETSKGWLGTSLNGFVNYLIPDLDNSQNSSPSLSLEQSRVMLRLQSDKPAWTTGWYQTGLAGGNPVELTLYTNSEARSILNSYLVLQGKGEISLELFEKSFDTERSFTKATLSKINRELRALSQLRNGDELPSSILPFGSTKITQEQEVQIDESQLGIYQVHGYLNPGQKGYIYLRVLNKDLQKEVLLGSDNRKIE